MIACCELVFVVICVEMKREQHSFLLTIHGRTRDYFSTRWATEMCKTPTRPTKNKVAPTQIFLKGPTVLNFKQQ